MKGNSVYKGLTAELSDRKDVPSSSQSTKMVYLSLFLALLGSVAADFLSGSHPPPRDLASEQSLVASAWQNVTSTLDNASSNELLAGLENITYSIGMFSLHDAAATVLQYHHTSSATANSSVGTRKVDQDSIYKVASVSKLITTYTGIVALSDEDWNRPLKTIAPILSAYLQNYTDQIYHVQWNQITPWTLASQMSGIPTVSSSIPPWTALLTMALTAWRSSPRRRSLQTQ